MAHEQNPLQESEEGNVQREWSPSSSELEAFRPKGVVHATHWLLPDVPAHPAHCVIVVAQVLGPAPIDYAELKALEKQWVQEWFYNLPFLPENRSYRFP